MSDSFEWNATQKCEKMFLEFHLVDDFENNWSDHPLMIAI